MQQQQLLRRAATDLLSQHGLLFSEQANLLQPGRHGLDLLKYLAESFKIELIPLPADSELLQGSLATYLPYVSHKPHKGGNLCYNHDLDPAEQVFAIAHEIGHRVLHHGQTICHRQDLNLAQTDTPLSGQVEVYNPHNLREQQANTFALELLIPAAELWWRYLNSMPVGNGLLVGQHGQLLDELAHHFEVKRYRLLQQLSSVFLSGITPDFSIVSKEGQEKTPATSPTRRDLDADQKRAATIATPALVLAGPGAGKTATLVSRVTHLVQGQSLNPARILVLTFSNKAAGELRERLARAGLPAQEIAISTFHAYGLDFLRRHAARVGLSADFRLLDPPHAYLLLEDLLGQLPLGYYIRLESPHRNLHLLTGEFSRAKDYLQSAQDYQTLTDRMVAAHETDPTSNPANNLSRLQEKARIYALYEQHKHRRQSVDFGDLIMLPVKLLESDSQVRAEERTRYEHILVDEFQDINYASGELLRWLASVERGGHGNLWAVGDINQSIYRFRGAFPTGAGSVSFERNFADPTAGTPVNIVELRTNYRSLESVVGLANHLRQEMADDSILPLVADRRDDEPTATRLYLNEYANPGQEAQAIIANIRSNLTRYPNLSDHAILCQRHSDADLLAAQLTEAGLPVTRLGEFFNRPEIQEVSAVLKWLNGDNGLTLARLVGHRLPVKQVIEQTRQLAVRPAAILKHLDFLASLSEPHQLVAQHLSDWTDYAVGGLNNWRIWRLLAEYLFGWSGTVATLARNAHDQPTRQSLQALGQLLRLTLSFDQAEEAEVLAGARQGLGQPLEAVEEERVRQEKLRPSRQRRQFLRYLNALIQTDVRIEAGSGVESGGAVNILTAHTSKGLEFAQVYLPGLYRGGNHQEEPVPVGLYRGAGPDPQADARCLFYVAATRARDNLYLSWPRQKDPKVGEADGESEEDHAGVGRPNKMAEVLEPALSHRAAHPARWGELALPLPSVSVLPGGGEVVPSQGEVPTTISAGPTRMSFSQRELETYLKCPSRYYYEHELGSYTNADPKSRAFYRAFNTTQRQLHTQATTDQPPDRAALEKTYRDEWGAGLPAETETDLPDQYEFYLQQGLGAVGQLWQHHEQLMGRADYIPPAGVLFDQSAVVELEEVQVKFTIDRLEIEPDGSQRLIHTRTAKPMDEAKLDADTKIYRRLTLYALAYPHATITYEATGAHGVSSLPATKAHTKAQAYRNWQTKLADYHSGKLKKLPRANLLGKYDQAARAIRRQNFDPRPSDECQSCPFYQYVCPSQPT